MPSLAPTPADVNVAVVGAGAWGTAVAISAARSGSSTLLWARDAAQAQAMHTTRTNARYLPDVPLPASLQLTAHWDQVLQHLEPHQAGHAPGLLIIGTPMAALADTLAKVPAHLPVLWLCKGFEKSSGRLGHEIAQAVRPGARNGVLSGPSFAVEVARGQPTALVAASACAQLCEEAVAAFHSDSLRLYTSHDTVGVEVGGAVKNVLAIATGIADGLSLGLNARAAIITRGLAEMTRLGVALGAQPDTFMGLSGLGDLVLTATGHLSRNRTVGLQLAQGKNLTTILQELGHVSEGVYSASTVLQRAQALGVSMPITQAVVEVLEERMSPAMAVQRLMAREARAER